MADYIVTDTELETVANAIRSAGSTSSTLAFPSGFVSAIGALSSGGSASGVQFVSGVQDIAQTNSWTLGDLPFTPTNALLLLVRRSATKGILNGAIAYSGYTDAAAFGSFTNSSSGLITNIGSTCFTFGQDSVTCSTPEAFSIYGMYYYFVWNDGATQS